MGVIDPKTRFEVLKAAGFRCRYCGAAAPHVTLEIDHITPLAKGGRNDLTNYGVACWTCNRGKGSTPLTVMAIRRFPRVLSTLATSVREWITAVATARAGDNELTIVGYCAHGCCPTREVEVYVKDYDTNLAALVSQQGVHCPICGRVLELRRVTALVDERVTGSWTAAQLLEGDR